MSISVKQGDAAISCRLGTPRATQRRQRVFQSKASRHLLLPSRPPKWQPPPQRPTHFKRTTVTDPNGNTTTTTYNCLNEPVSVTNQTCGCAGMSGTTTYGYNAIGERTSMTDPSTNVTRYSYDGQGRLLTETAPNTGVISYVYDAAGDLSSETDPVGNTTTYAYDAANELTSTTEPQSPTHPATDAYNAAGELTSATDPDGRATTYAYDKAGRMTSQTWVGGSYTAIYNYNGDSELTSVSDPSSTYSFTYNALGQQTSVSNAGTPGVPTVTLNYGYDEFGNRTSLTDSSGGSISYTYDGDNRMTSLGLSVTGTLDANVTFAYDDGSRLTGITRTAPSVSGSHTITSSFSYNHSNEVTNITATDTTATVTLANYTYGYNPAGVLTSYQDNSGNSLTYGYDQNNELTSAAGTLASKSYTFTYNYDHNGNRTSTTTDINGSLTSATYTLVSGSNELKNDGTNSYTYDYNGNLTQTTNASGTVTYSWDYENRLTEATVKNSSGQVVDDEKFTYDVFGNRIGVSLTTTSGTQQLYTVYDGANPYIDFNNSGTLVTDRYLTNPNGLNQFYGQVSGSGTPQWFLTDNLGSIRQVIDTSGNVPDAITYDPYGSILNQTNSANAPRFLYAGGAYDSITGDYQFGAREENALDGRWASQDPLGLQPDSNPYRYVSNEPTNAVDPTGEKYEYRVDCEKFTVYVRLEISIYGHDASRALARKWAHAIIQEWSGPAINGEFRDWSLSVEVHTEISKGYWSSEFNNIIEVGPRSMVSYVRRGIFNDTGEWAVNASDFTVAHEAGHLFYFDDFYTGTGKPLPGYAGTIMGEAGGTATKPGPGGMSFRDRLITKILRFGKKWDGEWHSGV